MTTEETELEKLKGRLLAEENYADILRNDIEQLTKDRNNLAEAVRKMALEVEDWKRVVRNNERDILELREERDQARRLYCVWREGMGEDGLSCKDLADRKGWDCFKENE